MIGKAQRAGQFRGMWRTQYVLCTSQPDGFGCVVTLQAAKRAGHLTAIVQTRTVKPGM